MEENQSSRQSSYSGRGRSRSSQRSGSRSGGGRRTYSRRPREESPAKKENPIIAFFKKLFGGGKKTSERGSRTRSSESGEPTSPRNGTGGRLNGNVKSTEETVMEVTMPKLYVGNLAYEVSESDLFDLFSKVGQVKNVEIVRDKSSRSKGFGFVEMSSLDSAKDAAGQFHRTDFQNRQLIVSGAKK